MVCHDGNSRTGSGTEGPRFPSFVTDWNQWEQKLNSGDHEAKQWLGKFNSKVAHGSMLSRVGLDRNSGFGQHMADFIEHEFDKRQRPATGGGGNGGTAPSRIGAAGASWMIDPNKRQEYSQVLAGMNIQDPAFRAAMLGFDAIWDKTGARSWSFAADDGASGTQGEKALEWTDPAGPPAAEIFKGRRWAEPFDKGFASDSNTRGFETFFMVRFPRDANGKLIKGVAGTEHRRYDKNMTAYDSLRSPWASFPAGTQVFEVIYSKSLGQPVAVDVLSRTKEVTADGRQAIWRPDAHRQDSSPEKIRNWVMRQPNWRSNPEYQKILNAVATAQRDEVRGELRNADFYGNFQRYGKPFLVNGRRTNSIPGTKSVLPRGVSRSTLLRMYEELPMTSALGSRGWQLESQDLFSGSHRGIPIDSKTCDNCHRLAGESFRNIMGDAGLDKTSTYAYGNGPGYDGVLSAPWYTDRELANYGRSGVSYRMRPEWGKFFESFDPNRHSTRTYRRTETNSQGSYHGLRGPGRHY